MKRLVISVVVSLGIGVLVLPLLFPTEARAPGKSQTQTTQVGRAIRWVGLEHGGQTPMPRVAP